MKFKKLFAVGLVVIGLFLFNPSSFGFALLGPVAPWMQASNGVLLTGGNVGAETLFATDIGGPMNLGSEYRWNVPVVTYGFDGSFLDYFGTNGVRSVESAIQILNDLPSASQMVLASYPLATQHHNFLAQARGVYDLKSVTLSLVLEQMGLAQPTRNIYLLNGWDSGLLSFLDVYNNHYYTAWFPWLADSNNPLFNYIVGRNFDPTTLDTSYTVNQTLYFGLLDSFINQNYIFPYPSDPLADTHPAVADLKLTAGGFYDGLTRDDVGGLLYLLAADNVNYEKLLPDVRFGGPRKAWRPGVEKVTFMPQPINLRSGNFARAIYPFTDFYLNQGVLTQQHAYRVVREPDILFCAADLGQMSTNLPTPWFMRTGTGKWLNNATLNGNTNGEGPGVIPPQIKITFHKLGLMVVTDDGSFSPSFYGQSWGSFDGSTNPLTVYPPFAQTNNAPLVIHFHLVSSISGGIITNATWSLPVSIQGQATLQTSTDRVNWTSSAVVTNVGAVIEWNHYGIQNPPKYFRVISQ